MLGVIPREHIPHSVYGIGFSFVSKVISNILPFVYIVYSFSDKYECTVDSYINPFCHITNNPHISVAYPNKDSFHAQRPASCLQLWRAVCVFQSGIIWGRLFWQRSETQEIKTNYASIFKTSARMGYMSHLLISQSNVWARILSMWWCQYSSHWREGEVNISLKVIQFIMTTG